MPVNEVVYSWRTSQANRLEWEYKLSLSGSNEIASKVSFPDFDLQIMPYASLPSWVVSKYWVNQTFVVPEGRDYISSEGIYEWSTTEGVIADITKSGEVIPDSIWIEKDCISGSGPCDLSNAFTSIAEGLRGEYKFDDISLTRLYVSPMDARLHLQGAQAGLFNLGSDRQLRLHNLDGGAYLDGWTLEQASPDPAQPGQPLEGLYRLGERYLHFGGGRVRLFSAQSPESLFETLPPSDAPTWQAFRQKMAGVQPKDPAHLAAWLDGLESEIMQLSLSLAGVPAYQDGRYRFELFLGPGYQVSGRDELGLAGLPPGRYSVSYDGRSFRVEPLTPPRLSLSLTARPDDPLAPGRLYHLDLAATNRGLQASPDLQLVVRSECAGQGRELLRRPARLPADGRAAWSLTWQPPLGRQCWLSAALYDANEIALAQAVLDPPSTDLAAAGALPLLQASTQGYRALLAFILLLLIAGLAGLAYWRRARPEGLP